jgi:polyphosphate kinase 2 (PPK2 family)
MKATDHAAARWHVVDGSKQEQRLLLVAQLLLDELRAAAAQTHSPQNSRGAQTDSEARRRKLLPTRPEKTVADSEYATELETLQGRLARLVRRSVFRKRALVLAFEGMDAGGKGGAIRRVTHALDARQYRVIPVSAPTPEEALHPYLWRFWRCIPELGAITIYDRSWYGRVLVERVRGLAPEADWKRAYDEIREFELQLAEHGIIVGKFWLNVGKQEQLRRFKARDEDSHMRFKVDKEDWENRRRFDAYQAAAIEMIERTHANYARWTVVPADHKKSARLIVLRAICKNVESALG